MDGSSKNKDTQMTYRGIKNIADYRRKEQKKKGSLNTWMDLGFNEEKQKLFSTLI